MNRHGEFEPGRYPAYVVAEIKADGSFNEAPARSVRWPQTREFRSVRSAAGRQLPVTNHAT